MTMPTTNWYLCALLVASAAFGRSQAPDLNLQPLRRLGTERWRAPVGWTPQALVVPGPDVVVVAAGDDGVTALDRASGTVVWQRDRRLRVSWCSRHSDLVLVQYSAGWMVRALEPATGAERWRTTPAARLQAEVVAAAGVVVLALGPVHGGVVTPARLVGCSAATGAERWSWPVVGTDVVVPVLAGTKVVVKSADGRLTALDLQSGEPVWAFDTLEPTASPAVVLDDGAAVAWTGRRTRYVLDGATGRPLAVVRLPERSTDALDGPGGTVLFGGRDGVFRCLDGRTGAIRWHRPLCFGPVDRLTAPRLVGTAVVVQWQGRRGALGADLSRQRPKAWSRRPWRNDDEAEPARLYAFDAAGGALRWSATTPSLVPGSERVVASWFVFRGRDGRQHVFDVTTGLERWSWPVEPTAGSLPLLTVAGDQAYLADGTGHLVAVALLPDW